MIAATGWTWDTIAHEMDLPKLAALNDYWQSHPPLHLMVSAWMGFKPPETPAAGPSDNDLSALMSLFPHRQP